MFTSDRSTQTLQYMAGSMAYEADNYQTGHTAFLGNNADDSTVRHETAQTGGQTGDLRTALIYTIVAVAVALFGAVYEHFSFGVWSAFMVYAFMLPLACGALPYMLRYMRGIRKAETAAEETGNMTGTPAAAAAGSGKGIGTATWNAATMAAESGLEIGTMTDTMVIKAQAAGWMWHAGIATLTTGSIVQGILEICGRLNSLTIVYLAAGVILLISAALLAIRNKRR